MVYYCVYNECPFWAGGGGIEVGGEPGGINSIVACLDIEEVDTAFQSSLSSPIGEDCCLSQMKLWVSFVRAMVMGLGMPWDFVRNLGHAAYCKLYDQGFGIEGWVSG